MLGELSDALGQQCDLDLGGASVPFGECVLSNDGGRLGTVKRHVISLFKAQQPQQGTFGATTLGGGSPSCPATEADREVAYIYTAGSSTSQLLRRNDICLRV